VSTQTVDRMTDLTPDEELDDLLPEDLLPGKHKAVPLVRTSAQKRAAAKAEAAAQAQALAATQAARLAQIVNLTIAGHSLADIGAAIGATPEEVDRLLQSDMSRYVRNQPALRTYVRNWISSKYMKMIEADWDPATDPTHAEKLENQDRVMRMLDRMAKLHGAEAPVQSEVKVDAAPEAVERLVNALASSQGLGYDVDIFDVEVVEDAVTETAKALEVSGNAVEMQQEGEPDDGF
jgi:hypothetical protein